MTDPRARANFAARHRGAARGRRRVGTDTRHGRYGRQYRDVPGIPPGGTSLSGRLGIS